jgi:hypothetical protein
MHIEVTMDLARTLVSVQDVLTENEIDLDWALVPFWAELQRVALRKVNEDFSLPTDINVKGPRRIASKVKSRMLVDNPRKV